MWNRVLEWLRPSSPKDKSYLRLFSPENLAMLSDWLSETGELYVDIYHPHSGGGSSAHFVYSMEELKNLIAKETWREIIVTIFRKQQYALRGIADEALLEKALSIIPDGEYYTIVFLEESKFPTSMAYWSGDSHKELKEEFFEALGQVVGIGQNPFDLPEIPEAEEFFEVDVLRSNQFAIRKNQDSYEPFSKNPKAYQWLIDLWNRA